MKISNKLWITAALLLALTLVGCKGESQPESSGGGLPEGVEGTATITYEYTYYSDDAQSSVYVEIPIQLKIDPDDDEVMNVTGDAYSTHYIQVKGAGGESGTCFISCDYPMHYFFIGKLVRVEEKGQESCAIQGEITTLFDIKDVKRSGTCPEVMVKNQDCTPMLDLPDDKKWSFTVNKLMDKKSDDPLEKATLSQMLFTKNVQKQCNWKTEEK